MARVIGWALGMVAMTAVSAVGTSERLAERFGLTSPMGLRSAQTEPAAARAVTVSADLQGHFVVHPKVDGRRIQMMVDTGASFVAFTYEDALAAGIRIETRDFTRKIATANGIVAVAPVRVAEVRIGDIAVRGIEAVVLPPGRLGMSLLGMSFLKRLNGFDISQGRLTLKG